MQKKPINKKSKEYLESAFDNLANNPKNFWKLVGIKTCQDQKVNLIWLAISINSTEKRNGMFNKNGIGLDLGLSLCFHLFCGIPLEKLDFDETANQIINVINLPQRRNEKCVVLLLLKINHMEVPNANFKLI